MPKALTCPVCGKVNDSSWYSGECSKECFDAGYWNEKVRQKENGDMSGPSPIARINGHHYVVCEHKPHERPEMLGCSGAKCTVRWTTGPHAGKEITTNNLWVQGAIPPEYRNRLPDNAEWVRERWATSEGGNDHA